MSWICPPPERLFEVIDATWSPAEFSACGPFTLRQGAGGGKRVSAATLNGTTSSATEIKAAEEAMLAMGQTRLFMIKDGDEALDKILAADGYQTLDPVTLFAAPIDLLAECDPKGFIAIRAPAPMAAMEEIWAEGGIGEGRLDIMRRVKEPKTCLLGRLGDAPSGAAFVACDGNIGMIHALEVLHSARRKGLGLQMTGAAAAWAKEQGADTFALVTVTENDAACGLYRGLGMVEVGHYHYRIKE